MNIEENNKLIAEFMAGYEVETHHNQYHQSWNELMPVVEKINTIENYRFSVKIHYCLSRVETDLLELISDEQGNDTIEATYKAVVEFIKWYNKNLNKKYHYRISTGAFFLPFDNGTVRASSRGDAITKAISQIREDLDNFGLDGIGFDSHEIEIEEV